MGKKHDSYCCFCIPFRFAVALISLFVLALGGASLYVILSSGVTESSYKIASYIATGVYLLLGVSGLVAVIFKKYALAKNFSVLWWTVTIIVTILSVASVILLTSRGKPELESVCRQSLLDTKYFGGPYDPDVLADDVDNCYKHWVIIAGVSVAVQVLVMTLGGWIASKYTSEVENQKGVLGYTYGKGYGPVHPQPQPHMHQQSPAHPYTNISYQG